MNSISSISEIMNLFRIIKTDLERQKTNFFFVHIFTGPFLILHLHKDPTTKATPCISATLERQNNQLVNFEIPLVFVHYKKEKNKQIVTF